MSEDVKGRIYDIQGFSVHDGPGIRTVVFLKGCPLRCPWCHSPESQEFYPQLSWIDMRCLGTETCEKRCFKACPKGALELTHFREGSGEVKKIQKVYVNRDLCDNCGACAKVCYPKALFVSGEDYRVDDIIKRVSKDAAFYHQSGGGVTISGGEPLSQPQFTLALLQELKARDINTALDTTGYAKWEVVESVLPYVDLFLLDLKHMDSKRHFDMVRVPNELIHENARKIAAAGGKFQIRIPVIPGFNDDEDNIRKTAVFCKELGDSVEQVQLLPYHNLGIAKYARISDKKVMKAVPPCQKKMEDLKVIVEEYGIKVMLN